MTGRSATIIQRSPVGRRTANVRSNGDALRVEQRTAGVVCLGRDRAPRFESEAPAGLHAERRDDDHVHRVEPVVIDDGPARGRGVLQPALHLGQPIAVIDGGEQAPVPSQEGLVLELEILGQRHQDPLRDRPARGVLPGRHIGGDGGEGGRVDPVRHAVQHLPRIGDDEPAGRCPRDDDPGPEDEDGGHDQADPKGAPGDPVAVAADQ